MKRLLALLIVLYAAVTAPAHALPCGTVLYAPAVLTYDVVCGPGQDGLIVAADKVRIDLNGFSIVGPDTLRRPTGPSIGVRSAGFEAVQIVGPGRITGFERAFAIEGGYNHLVRGLTALAESGLPATVRNASGAVVELNRLNALEIVSDRGQKAVANRILDNDIAPEPGMPGAGLALGGCDTADNMAANNRIDAKTRRAVNLHEGAHSNQVLENKVVDGEIFLDGSSNNLIARNSIYIVTFGYTGVMADTSIGPVDCAGRVHLPSARNSVRGNRFHGGYVGVILDDSMRTGVSTANVVTGNSFTSLATVALLFGPGSNGNDGRGNVYTNNFADVYDFGSSNLWP